MTRQGRDNHRSAERSRAALRGCFIWTLIAAVLAAVTLIKACLS